MKKRPLVPRLIIKTTKRNTRPTRIYHTHREDPKSIRCVYCAEDHRPIECTKVTNLSDRRQILFSKRFCFSLTSENHRASNWPSKWDCQRSQNAITRRFVTQYTPLATLTTRRQSQKGLPWRKTKSERVCFPVIVVEVKGIKRRMGSFE